MERATLDPAGARVPQRSTALDVLRGVAAVMVLLWHAYPVGANGAFDHGWSMAVADTGLGQGGVTLFFVLSGLLIGGPFIEARLGLRRAPDLRAYALRRAARIVPAYWVALAGTVVVIGLVGMLPPTGGQLLEHLLFVQNEVPGEANGFFPPGWTLGIEAMFYIALPVALVALWRRGEAVTADRLTVAILAVWLTSSAAAFCAWGWFPDQSAEAWATVAPNSLLATVFMFCPGLLIAVARAAPDSRASTVFTWLGRHAMFSTLLIACAFTAACACELPGNSLVLELRYQALMIAAALLVNLALQWRVAWRGGLGVFAALGRWSYGIYLWHYPVALAVSHTGLTPPASDGLVVRWALFALPVVVVTVALAALSFHVVERPLIERAQEWGRRRAPGAERHLRRATT